MNFNIENIKNYLKQIGMTYAELSIKANIPIGTLKAIFSGRNPNPRIDTMQAILSALGFDEDFSLYDIEGISPLPEYDLLPLLGTIACGTPTLAEENIEEYVKADKSIKANFVLRCKGDSMIMARIFDGDMVYIRQQEKVENGEIAAVLVDGEATLKRVYNYPNRIELRPENPMYSPLNYEGDDTKKVKILGKAVAFFSLIR